MVQDSSIKVALSKKQNLMAFLVSSFPFVLGFILFIFNPAYIGRMILPCFMRQIADGLCSQPMGWVAIFIMLLLTVMSYLTIISVFTTQPNN